MDHENRIAGERRSSRSAGRLRFKAAAAPRSVLATVPRSGPEEVEEARAVLETGRGAWARRSARDRADLVLDGIELLDEALVGAEEGLAAGYGLDPHELRDELDSAVAAARAASLACAGGPARRRGTRGGIALLAPDWRVPLPVLSAALTSLLAEGESVLFLAPELQPLAPALAVGALLEAGVPGDALALLHAPTGAALESAVQAGVTRLHAWGDRETIARVRRLAAGASIPEQRLRLHRASVDALDAEADLEQEAERAVLRAFGRARTLSGQRGGQLACLHVPVRMLSAFTEALLAAFDVTRDATDPLPLHDAACVRRLRRARTLGMDEGATLVAGGAGDLQPVVFTNGEPHMDSARRVEPAPVLLLCRERQQSASTSRVQTSSMLP